VWWGRSVTPSPYCPLRVGVIDEVQPKPERWRVMIGMTIRLILFVVLMSIILIGVFSVFGIILLMLVAAPLLFLFALL